MTRPAPAEGFQRVVVTDHGRRKAVDVPVVPLADLEKNVRDLARQGTISFAERDRYIERGRATLNADGTPKDQAVRDAQSARSTKKRAARSRAGRSR